MGSVLNVLHKAVCPILTYQADSKARFRKIIKTKKYFEDIMQRIIFELIICLLFTALVAEEEIVSRRTFFSKTYHIDNNQYRMRLNSEPIHYQDSEGNYIEIDQNAASYDSLVALAWNQNTGRDLTLEANSYRSIARLTGYNNSNEFLTVYQRCDTPCYGKLTAHNNEWYAWETAQPGGIVDLRSVTYRQINEYHPISSMFYPGIGVTVFQSIQLNVT
jgi:hypothetical protein